MADKRDSIAIDATCSCGQKYATRQYSDNQELMKKDCPNCAFGRLADNRTNNALKHIDLIGNLASGQYKYGQSDIDMITGALTDAVVILADKFNKPVKNEKKRFTLKRQVNAETVVQLNQED